MINLSESAWILVLLIGLKTITEVCLDYMNYKHVARLKGPLPKSWSTIFDQTSFDKTIRYTISKLKFSSIEHIYHGIILILILSFHFLPWLFHAIQSRVGTSLSADALIFLLITLILTLPLLPFEWWSQFKIEAKYGFNRSTLGLWLSDKAKGIILSFVLGFPLVWLLLRFHQTYPETWWLWGFVALTTFQISIQVLYPWLILPLFNKRTPLEEGPLKAQLLALAHKANFSAQTIQVIDGSKRSSHSNAFFSGFGKFRCIILFDTLIKQLSHHEVEAVLAHEIGHYKKGHIPKRLILSSIISLIGFKVVDWLIQQNWLYTNFGFSAELGIIPALIIFILFSGVILFWLTPILNWWSRVHEFEADAFAAELQGTSKHLIQALHKLYKENLSNLDPHPVYSNFYYSHPTLIEREKSLKES